MTDRQPKSQYNMEGATLVDAANHLLWLLGHMANRLHNATSPASVGEQKADAAILMDETQPLLDAMKACNVYRADGRPLSHVKGRDAAGYDTVLGATRRSVGRG